MKSYTQRTMKDPYRIVTKYGYEYHLREVFRDDPKIPEPCFMGFPNMALIKCVKIKKNEKI